MRSNPDTEQKGEEVVGKAGKRRSSSKALFFNVLLFLPMFPGVCEVSGPITTSLQVLLVIDRLIPLQRHPLPRSPGKNRFSQMVKWVLDMADL